MKTAVPTGFELRELRLCGPDVAHAQLKFVSGLNVIEGASDTGKSYAVSCIDFLLGAKDPPEEIPEASGYDAAYLWIQSAAGEDFTLKRALAGGNIGLFKGALDDAFSPDVVWETLGITNKSTNAVSKFLLELCGLKGKLVRKNADGNTQEVSFRTFSKAMIIDEERIIAKRSPIRGTQKTSDTASASTLRLLLTGLDDSEIIPPEDKKIAAGRAAGKKEIIEALVDRDAAALDELIRADLGQVSPDALERLDATLQELSGISSAALSELRDAEKSRAGAWKSLRESRERWNELGGMLARAALLDEHYDSDLGRLEAMGEAAHVLRHYSDEACRYCGAEPEHQRSQGGESSVEATMQAAAAETGKVQRLKRELANALTQMQEERASLGQAIEGLQGSIEEQSKDIAGVLTPRVRKTAEDLRTFQSEYKRLVQASELTSRITSLREQLSELEQQPAKREKLEFVGLTADVMADACAQIGVLLKAWGLPVHGPVVFDEKSADILIGGRPRTGHGKGVRAVTCAAFAIGLMQHSKLKQLGHPGFVVVDTPLNPYRPADVDDEGRLTDDVKSAFYKDLCDSDKGQVVVFENVAPPDEVQAACNYEHFSKSGIGRYGFIPMG